MPDHDDPDAFTLAGRPVPPEPLTGAEMFEIPNDLLGGIPIPFPANDQSGGVYTANGTPLITGDGTGLVNVIEKWIDDQVDRKVNGSIAGDAYHSMEELYEFRMIYHALWVNAMCLAVKDHYDFFGYKTVKSWKHSDGEPCFGGGWFIVVSETPAGQVSNHYKAEYWEFFQCAEVDIPPEYDGHTSQNVLNRLFTLADNDRNNRG